MTIKVYEVKEVVDHPNADRLSLIKFGEHTVISSKLEDGTPRYKVGEMIIFCPDETDVRPRFLRDGYWDEEKNRPGLGGPLGTTVNARKIRGVQTDGIIFPVDVVDPFLEEGADVSSIVEIPYLPNHVRLSEQMINADGSPGLILETKLVDAEVIAKRIAAIKKSNDVLSEIDFLLKDISF